MNKDLSAEEQKLVREAYFKSRDNTVEHDISYVANLKSSTFNRLVSSDDPSLRRMGEAALQLQRFIGDCLDGSWTAQPNVIHAYTAVLLYLVNPFDFIPDCTPERGYADDLYVLELGLADGGDALGDYAAARGIHLP